MRKTLREMTDEELARELRVASDGLRGSGRNTYRDWQARIDAARREQARRREG